MLLSAVPLVTGALRLVQLTSAPAVIPADDRCSGCLAAPVLPILGASVFAPLGVVKRLPRPRRAHRTWHRCSGRVVVDAGLAVSRSALLLAASHEPQRSTGPLLLVLGLLVTPAMAADLQSDVAAIRHGDVDRHRAWMVRAHAPGLGAGMQVLTGGSAEAAVGTSRLRSDGTKGPVVVINRAVAEWVVSRPSGRPRRCVGALRGGTPAGALT